MPDENKTPHDDAGDMSTDDLREVAASVPGPTAYPPGQAEEAAATQPPQTGLEAAALRGLRTSERIAPESPVTQAWDEGISAIEEGIESLGGTAEVERAYSQRHHQHGETTTLFGRTYDIPIYTSVFMALGVLTIIEVLIAELFGSIEPVKIALLLSIAVAKALLVVIFYMHLNTDSRVFAITLGLPVFLALMGTIYLVAVPASGGY